MVDNLCMTYDGNRLVSVRDDASRHSYAGATDFDGVPQQEYALTYNDAGSLTSDAGRKIANIDYDLLNNPIRIQFTDGNVTKYTYSATGEKLRVIYQTAVPNISVPIGSTKELSPSEILYTDSIDYLLGDALTLKNGRIDKYQFDEGYCQAERYTSTQDLFTFCYYDLDHLGNVRQVTEDCGDNEGWITQKNDYYPFGTQFCDGTASNNAVQSHKFNGKELDLMHGLNTYDYGARQYNPVVPAWDRMDPLCEKYYGVSPYAYCANNPIRFIDKHGEKPTYSEALAMTQHVYGGYDNNVLIGGWQPSSFNIGLQFSNPENGLNSILYERIVNGDVAEFAYVTAGTVDLQDVKQDVKQLVGTSEQYVQSMENAELLSIQLSNRELTYIGHSLGAGEAGINLLATAHHNPNKRSAIGFNPAAVSNATIHNLGLNRSYENKITSYEMGADIVSWGERFINFKPLGNRICIAEPFKFPNIQSHRINSFPKNR